MSIIPVQGCVFFWDICYQLFLDECLVVLVVILVSGSLVDDTNLIGCVECQARKHGPANLVARSLVID